MPYTFNPFSANFDYYTASSAPGGASGDLQYNNAGAFGGITPGAGIVTWLGTPSSANLAAAVTGETGTGALVFGTAPTLTSTVANPVAVSGPGTKISGTSGSGTEFVGLSILNTGNQLNDDASIILHPASGAGFLPARIAVQQITPGTGQGASRFNFFIFGLSTLTFAAGGDFYWNPNPSSQLSTTGIAMGAASDGRIQSYIRQQTLSGFTTRLHLGTSIGVNNAIDRLVIDSTAAMSLVSDASNFVTFTTSSVGSLTIAPTGTNPSITLTPAGSGLINLNGPVTVAAGKAVVIDTTTLVVDATNDRVGIGTATPAVTLDVVGDFATSTESTANPTFTKYIASTAAMSQLMRKARGTTAAPRRAQSGDVLGGMAAMGAEAVDDATAAVFTTNAASMRFFTTEAHTSTAHGAKVTFQACPIGSVTLATLLTLDENGGTFLDGLNLITGTSTGMKIGTATSQKLGLWNTTPVVQPASANQAAFTDSTGGVVAGSLVDVATLGVSDPAKVNANFATVAQLLLAMRTAMMDVGSMKGAA